MTLESLWEGIKGRRARKTLSMSIPPGRVSGEALGEPPEDPGYFQIRLSEMFLRDERVLWNEWAPATLFLCEFKYGGEDVRSPFFVSNQLLRGIEKAGPGLATAGVRFRNTRIVGPVPHAGDEVAVFAGLFRTKTGDLRKSLFSVFDKLFGAVDMAGLGAYLKVADKLIDEVLKSFGMSDVECLLAERNVFGTPTQPLRDGYYAMLNIDERSLDRTRLHVHEGTLQQAGADGRLTPFDLCDYCLIRIETLETRSDYTTLPFDKIFREALALLPQGKVAEGKALLIRCLNAVVSSSDLSQAHKYRLTEYYQVTFFKDRERYARLSAEVPRGEAERKGADDVTAELEIKLLQDRIERHPELASARESLDHIAMQLSSDRVEPAAAPDADRETSIANYLKRRDVPAIPGSVSPEDLVRALTVGSMAD